MGRGFIWSSPLSLLRGSLSLDGWLSLVKGAPLEMGQCSSHSRVQIPVRPVPWTRRKTSASSFSRTSSSLGKKGGLGPLGSQACLLANSVGLPAAATMLQQVYAELQVKAGVDHSTLIWVDYD